MDAIKPLVVLVLFGTILYGAYSVVQKGPSPGMAETAEQAPAFQPPQVDIPVTAPAPQATVVAAAPAATPFPATPAPAPAALPAATPAMPAIDTLPAPPVGAAPMPAAVAAASAAAPTYLPAESAPPPGNDPSATTMGRPERYATLPGAEPPPAAAAIVPPPVAPAVSGSASAFATAWSDAHDKLAAGRYAEALSGLSVWYDDPSLGLEESQQLEDLLGQLAGTVFYSQQDLLLPPHVVAAGETLPTIAAPLGVSWQLLAKINGVRDPMQLVPGEHLKLIRGPFDAVVSISRRRLSLQVAGSYAGSFPVVVGRQFLGRVGGSLPVLDIRRGAADVVPVAGPGTGRRGLPLGEGLVIEAADDPNVVGDDSSPSSLVVSVRDLDELLDILGPGSRVLVRQ
jgi:LysM repeat protein